MLQQTKQITGHKNSKDDCHLKCRFISLKAVTYTVGTHPADKY